MYSPYVSRRRLLQAAGAAAVAAATAPVIGDSPAAAAIAPARPDIGVAAFPFEFGQVRLSAGRWLDNQNRTLSYLRFVDVNRLLYKLDLRNRTQAVVYAYENGIDKPEDDSWTWPSNA